MFIEILSVALGSGLGGVAGWFIRKFKEPIKPSVVLPPNMAEGTYEVRFNGRKVYAGEDLQKAKNEFKRDIYTHGVVEIYSQGNHVASRKVP